MLSRPLLALSLLSLLCASIAENCEDFQELACDLSENNIIGHDRLTNTPAECQALCKGNADCAWFTHFETECYLLRECGHAEHCGGCVSGPTSPDISTCPWPPGPAPETTSTTTLPTTTTGDIDSACSDFEEAACELSESNIVGHDRFTNTAGECQAKCRDDPVCSWFTHFDTNCYLLSECGTTAHCEECVSGPATPDLSTCSWPPVPTTSTTTTTTTTITPCATTASIGQCTEIIQSPPIFGNIPKDLCGKCFTCNYKNNICELEEKTEQKTCLKHRKDGNSVPNRPPLQKSNNVQIIKFVVETPLSTTTTAVETPLSKQSNRNQRCNLDDGQSIVPLPSNQKGPQTNLARAAVEILDAIYWLADIKEMVDGKEIPKSCQNMRKFTLAIAKMKNEQIYKERIYLAGNLDFAGVDNGPKWRTFELDEPVKLAIRFILVKWGFSIKNVFVLKTDVTTSGDLNPDKLYMKRHAEMQLVSYARQIREKIVDLGVSKTPCCKCDEKLSDRTDMYIADVLNVQQVFSGPGTQPCEEKFRDWCGSQFGSAREDYEVLKSAWRSPSEMYYTFTEHQI